MMPKEFFASLLLVSVALIAAVPAAAIELRVPQEFATIQAAIDAAVLGDVVRVAPGVYVESLTISSKRVELVSEFVFSGDPADIDATVIDGAGGASVISVLSPAGSELSIRGFTIRNGGDGILAHSLLEFRDGVITNTADAIDFEAGANGSVVSNSLIHNNLDDALDLDGGVGVLIVGNDLVDNNDDGIEIRLHDFVGPQVDIVIRDNLIARNGEDGIQLIDGALLSPRFFLIERNVIADNALAGIGMMANMNTVEDLQGAPIAEPVHLFNNTFIGNDHGLTGGTNLVSVNNLFEGQTTLGVKNVAGGSTLAHSLFFNNGLDQLNSNVDAGTTVTGAALLDPQYTPQSGSAAIDSGTDQFVWNSQLVLDLAASEFEGLAPEIGAIEVPEPSFLALLMAGVSCMAGLGSSRRRRAKLIGPFAPSRQGRL
jgi:hypothetical protein